MCKDLGCEGGPGGVDQYLCRYNACIHSGVVDYIRIITFRSSPPWPKSSRFSGLNTPVGRVGAILSTLHPLHSVQDRFVVDARHSAFFTHVAATAYHSRHV